MLLRKLEAGHVTDPLGMDNARSRGNWYIVGIDRRALETPKPKDKGKGRPVKGAGSGHVAADFARNSNYLLRRRDRNDTSVEAFLATVAGVIATMFAH